VNPLTRGETEHPSTPGNKTASREVH
jgi:hypothetical protein